MLLNTSLSLFFLFTAKDNKTGCNLFFPTRMDTCQHGSRERISRDRHTWCYHFLYDQRLETCLQNVKSDCTEDKLFCHNHKMSLTKKGSLKHIWAVVMIQYIFLYSTISLYNKKPARTLALRLGSAMLPIVNYTQLLVTGIVSNVGECSDDFRRVGCAWSQHSATRMTFLSLRSIPYFIKWLKKTKHWFLQQNMWNNKYIKILYRFCTHEPRILQIFHARVNMVKQWETLIIVSDKHCINCLPKRTRRLFVVPQQFGVSTTWLHLFQLRKHQYPLKSNMIKYE